jgi:hypothetical protein
MSGLKGNVKFWVKEGALPKYEYHVEGKISGQNGSNSHFDREVFLKDESGLKSAKGRAA